MGRLIVGVRMSMHHKPAVYQAGDVQKTMGNVGVELGRTTSSISRDLEVEMIFDAIKVQVTQGKSVEGRERGTKPEIYLGKFIQ